MAKSRFGIAVLLVGTSAAVAAQPPASADEAIARAHARLTGTADTIPCNASSRPENIVVCGRRAGPDRYRLPLPVQPLPGARVAGEPMSQVAASEVGSEPCTTIGPMGGCGSYVPILPFALWVVHVAVKAVQSKD